jgi:thiamine-phosphate pyrophosphorylase
MSSLLQAPPARHLGPCSLLDRTFSLYLVTDRQQTCGRPLVDVVHAALDGGVDAVQLREKDLLGAELLRLATQLRDLTTRYGAALLINDRIDVALAAGADGVHLGQDAIPPADARRIVGATRLVGTSTHSPAEAGAAGAGGADFVVFGPVYRTPSKTPFGPPRGPDELAEVTASVRLPVFAIGGITAERVAEVRQAGAAGIAVISAIIAAEDPTRAAQELLAALRG